MVRCLVIGATGYVGARLVPRLLAGGHTVRCLVRDGAKLARLDWADRVEVHGGDVTDVDATRTACRGVDAAFHLVHSMDGPDFAERDRRAAAVLASAAGDAGVRRVVYLGGLQPNGVSSAHLASRREVGELLVAGRAPAAVLQAGIVVGRGSASFEMIRHLAEASPVLPMPDRAWNVVQPIGIDDVLHHLLAALDLPPEVNRSFDIGGPDVLTYAGLVTGYAAVAGLSRPLIVPVPVSAPNLAARAVEALTAVDRHLAGPLLESMAHDLVCRDDPPPGAPPGGPMSYSEAVRRACDGEGAAGRLPTDPRGPELVSEHVERVNAPPAAVWAVISGLGGETGWYTVPGCGRCAGRSTGCWAASVRAGRDRRRSGPAPPSTGGGSRASSPGGCCGSARS